MGMVFAYLYHLNFNHFHSKEISNGKKIVQAEDEKNRDMSQRVSRIMTANNRERAT